MVDIDRIARTQYGLITWAQLMTTGLARSSIWRLVERGALIRVHPGVDRLAGSPVTWEQRQLAAVLAGGPEAASSHRAGAHVWDVYDGEPPIEISVPRRQALVLPGVIVHRTRDPMRLHVRRGIPVTTPMRVITDLGAVVSVDVVEAVLDRAEGARLVTVAAVEWELAAVARPGRRGTGALRQVLDRRALLEEPPDGVLEPRFARLCKLAGLPMPVFQHPVGRFKLDFAYPELLLAIEVYGYGPHASRRAFQRDRDRQNVLVGRGWTVLRFTWADVVKRPEHVARLVAAAIGQRQFAMAN
jgi:very-short-patch-repair endonuclease